MRTIIESPLFSKLGLNIGPKKNAANLPHFWRSIRSPVTLSWVRTVFVKFAEPKKALVNAAGFGCCM
ncbi:MAG: hypothetical protein LM550_04490 [Candidatus Contendobacter sp.]|jgi:hypothetical protein|nr:hypothetical protein [Candidatus Contendobacter sp.]